jgi:hypothetical protein
LFYGIVPHTFCILFIVFSIAGATMATSVLQQVLYVPYLFQIIVALSLGFATLSAMLYLRRNGLLSWPGAKRKWRYLSIMYGTTLTINLLFFWVIFPTVANMNLTPAPATAQTLASAPQSATGGDTGAVGVEELGVVTLQVAIPCPGHAPLIINALKKAPGVQAVRYGLPNRFRVSYDAEMTTIDEMMAQPVFDSFRAVVLP